MQNVYNEKFVSILQPSPYLSDVKCFPSDPSICSTFGVYFHVFCFTTWLSGHVLQPCPLAPGLGRNWNSPVETSHGSSAFAWACIHKLSLGFTQRRKKASPLFTANEHSEPNHLIRESKPTDSWLAPLSRITNPQKSRADRCLYAAHLAAVPGDMH